MKIATVGLDLAKNVFQLHAVDAQGHVVARKQLRRTEVLRYFAKLEPYVVGMEACGSSHYWGRELAGAVRSCARPSRAGDAVRARLRRSRPVSARGVKRATRAVGQTLDALRRVTLKPFVPGLTADVETPAQLAERQRLFECQANKFLSEAHGVFYIPGHGWIRAVDCPKVSTMSPYTCRLCLQSVQIK